MEAQGNSQELSTDTKGLSGLPRTIVVVSAGWLRPRVEVQPRAMELTLMASLRDGKSGNAIARSYRVRKNKAK